MRPAWILALLASLSATTTAPGQADPATARARPLPPVADIGLLAEQLVVQSERFVETVRYELSGTRQGRNLEIRGNALLAASESYLNLVGSGFADPARRLRALDGVEKALAEVWGELNNPPGTAPLSTSAARSIGRVLEQLRNAEGGLGPLPPPTTDPAGYDSGRIGRFADATRVNAGSLANQVDREIGYLYPFESVARDLRGLADDLDAFARLVRRRAPPAQVQASFRPILGLSRRIGRAFNRPEAPANLVNLWRGIESNLARIDELVLGDGGGTITPPRPPGGVRPPTVPPGPTPLARAVDLIDQALGELDAYAAAIRPSVDKIPEGPQFQNDARNLRDALISLRAPLAAGTWNASARRAFGRADSDSKRLADRTIRVSGGQIGPNNARALRVRELVDQIRRLLPQS